MDTKGVYLGGSYKYSITDYVVLVLNVPTLIYSVINQLSEENESEHEGKLSYWDGAIDFYGTLSTDEADLEYIINTKFNELNQQNYIKGHNFDDIDIQEFLMKELKQIILSEYSHNNESIFVNVTTLTNKGKYKDSLIKMNIDELLKLMKEINIIGCQFYDKKYNGRLYDIELVRESDVHLYKSDVKMKKIIRDISEKRINVKFQQVKELVKPKKHKEPVVVLDEDDKVVEAELIENKNEKDDEKMMKNFKLPGFNSIEGLVGLSMLDGKVAYNLGGKWVSLGLDGSLIDVSAFTKELDVDSMVIPTMSNQVQYGDLIIIDDSPVLVLDALKSGEIKTINGDGEIKAIIPTTNQLYGGSIVNKVFNPLINGFMGQGGVMNGNMMNNPMMMMAMMGEGKAGSSDMMMVMAMSGMMQNNMQQNNAVNQMQYQQPQFQQAPYQQMQQQPMQQPVQPQQAQPMNQGNEYANLPVFPPMQNPQMYSEAEVPVNQDNKQE